MEKNRPIGRNSSTRRNLKSKPIKSQNQTSKNQTSKNKKSVRTVRSQPVSPVNGQTVFQLNNSCVFGGPKDGKKFGTG